MTLRQRLHSHTWKHATDYPVHGWADTPHWNSYCDTCKVTGKEYNLTLLKYTTRVTA